MTDHPLTEEAVTERWNSYPRLDYWKTWDPGFRADLVSTHRAAFDAGREHERANPVDDRPWEPLAEGEPLKAGDEVRQVLHRITATAVVGRVDEAGNPWTTEGSLIGLRYHGTWHVRRAAPELPPERDGVVLVPADGHEAITTTKGQEFARLTFTTKQDLWYGPNLAARPGDRVIQTPSIDRLTPGTWKVEDNA